MAAKNADKAVLDEIINNQDLLPKFGVDTPKKIAHFLVQCGHESGGFRMTNETSNIATFEHHDTLADSRDVPDFVEVGEAGIAVDDTMRRQRRVQLVG